MLDFGSLEGGIESDIRMEYADSIYMICYPPKPGEEESFSSGKENKHYFRKLRKLLSMGKSVRIWCDDTPNGMCGLYAMCAFLRGYDNKIYVIKSPRCINSQKEWCIAPGWGSFNMVPMDDFLTLTRELDHEEQNVYAAYWDKLVSEDAPLRTVIAGLPISVSKDFYDRFIYKFLPDEPIKVASLIRQITGKYLFGVNTIWYEKRIWDLIDMNKLEVISTGDHNTEMAIQKC